MKKKIINRRKPVVALITNHDDDEIGRAHV